MPFCLKFSSASLRFVSAALLTTINLTQLAQSKQESPSRIVVHAKRYAFSPAEITLKRDKTTKMILISDDVPHGLTVEALGIHAQMVPGHHIEVVIKPKEAGDFSGACSVYCGSGHRDMEFVVHVVN